jgi:hypothetical protein
MTTTPATKRCPGFAPIGQAPHDVPADAEHFGAHKGSKDGLQVYCRTCDRAYQKAWRESKAAKAAGTAPAAAAPAAGEPQLPPPTVRVSPTRATPVYHDELAQRAAKGKAPGYGTETIGGVIYALPTNGDVTTDEGQAALAATNEAHAAARRKRDAERKRAERAAKKAQATA